MIEITDKMVDELKELYKKHHGDFHYSGMLLQVVKNHGASGEHIRPAMQALQKAHRERRDQDKRERTAKTWRRIA